MATVNRDDIRRIAAEVVGWLRDQQVSTVVMACNTTNALARDVAEGQAGGAGDRADRRRRRHGGNPPCWRVLATPATVASSAYRASIEALHPGAVVIEQACPAFVPLIEAGEMSSDDLRRAWPGLSRTPAGGFRGLDRAGLHPLPVAGAAVASAAAGVGPDHH